MTNTMTAVAGLLTLASVAGAQTVAIPGDPNSKSISNQQFLIREGANQKASHRDIAVFTGDVVIPQFVDGGSWKTSVTLLNLDSHTVHFFLLFFNDDGSDLTVRVLGQGLVKGIEVTLATTESATFETSGDAPVLSQGWATIKKDNDSDAVGGLAIFRQRIPGRPDFEAVVPIVSQFDSHFVLLFDNTAFTTAMAIANPTQSSVDVPITIRNERGQVIDQRTETLGAFQHAAFTLTDQWRSTAGIRGSIEFLTSGFGVAVLGLRFNGTGAFTSFHVLSNINWLTH